MEKEKLFEKGESVFGSKAKFEAWLSEKCGSLGNVTPKSLLSTTDGIKRVDEVLIRIEQGAYN